MTRQFHTKSLAVLALAAGFAAVSLSACGGGSGEGGGGGGGDAPTLLRITMQGISTPLWQNIAGTPTPAPACPTGAPLNGQIFFSFGGPVDPGSLPSAGQADGSIIVSATSGGQTIVAQGTFTVVDEPGLPPGNNRRVIFQPSLPNSPANPTQSGLTSALQYTVFVPRAGSSPQVVNVAGQGLISEAITCFIACQIPPSGSATACFVDSSPGAPYITFTIPDSGNPSPPPVDPASVQSNTVSIFVSEALDPANIDTANIKLILQPAGFQVPGAVSFTQAGVDPLLGSMSRIDYVASSQLLASATYEVQISSLVTDFGGNSVEGQQGNPTAQRFFTTIQVTFCNQAPIIEGFDSTQNRDVVGTPLVWNGSGQLFTTFPSGLVGDGSAGPIVFSALGSPHIIDTSTFSAPGVSQGVWNATSLTIEANATVILSGGFPVHFKCQGAAIFGANSAVLGSSPRPDNIGNTLNGPWKGGLNNNSPTPGGSGNWIVLGGKPGPGGGRGGDASQDSLPPSGVPRTLQGELADGASVNGVPGIDPNDSAYGPGQGGQGAQQVLTTIGAGGGAGGSSYGSGGAGLPLNGVNSTGLCGAPITGPQVTPAPSTGPVAAFFPPVSTVRGGSGGGGGGDRFDLVTATLNLDDQGGGGGGGGGGIRVSAVLDVTIQAGARIEMNGSPGNNCASLGAGAGGSGSGGMIWLQSFGQLNIDPTANLQVHGGVCPTGPAGLLSYRCSSAPGLGGEGLYQLEDSDGIIPINFQGNNAQATSVCATNQTNPNPLPSGMVGPGNNIAPILFPFSVNIGNTALSTWFDTGYGAPEYLNADPGDELFTLGNVPGGNVIISYQGSPEDFNNPGTPSTDPSTYSQLVTGNQLASLTGFRFVRFEVRLEYSSPPASSASNTFPAVQRIQIDFRSPIGCP